MRRRVIPSRRWGTRLSGPGLLRVGALAALLVPLTAASSPDRGPIDFTNYHDHAALTTELQRLVGAHRDIARLVPIGESRGGRTIWAVEIAAGRAPAAERPAVLIAANLEGDQVIGSELALYTVEWLLTQYATNLAVKRQIDEQAFFIVPRVNPDAAEAMFRSPRTGQRGNLRPYDDDNDARIDEDPADDLNGDGFITVMRVRDPAGPYRVHASEPRLMVRADASKGESGGWALYVEGRDDDRDGFYNEDGVGGVDGDRNFQHAYPYYAADAGPHMVSEPETRALMDYVLSRPGIAAILTYGSSDNLVTAPNAKGELGEAAGIALAEFAAAANAEARKVGTMQTGGSGFGFGFRRPAARTAAGTSGGRPSGGQRPATTVNEKDLEYFRAISERYRELTGVRRTAVTRKPAGAFFEYGYYQFGVPSFSTPGWGIEQAVAAADSAAPEPAPRGGPGRGARGASGESGSPASAENDVRLLAWLDARQVDGFASWTPFTHPQLGAVEIGGFKPYAVTNPPAAEIAELGAKHAEFAHYLATLMPRVRIAETKVTSHGGGVFRIEAQIENSGYLPTATAHGVTARAVQPVMVQLGVEPDAIITGASKTSFVDALAGSATRQKFEWVVRGQPGAQVQLRLRSQKAGSESVTLTLR